MSVHRLSLVLVLLLPSTLVVRLPAAEKEPGLTAEDKKYLDGLMKEFLFDRKGADAPTVTTIIHTVWASAGRTTTDGWFLAGKDGKPGRVYFTDVPRFPLHPNGG